ncbi:hypothetical protein C1H46_008848 [Malus baccata]|uniref:DNA topoisomerase (ATP-hydrolyzing) n=1 Tax=Malus baccata TaxID=106549 RepID=A0A540N4Q3_MALBA|nr:hypothetical protein C1H46_008848 [Malus baccata]
MMIYVLEHLSAYGKRVEPKRNLTAGSTYVPNYNPTDIIDNMRRLIKGEKPVQMSPWYEGFSGTMDPIDTGEGYTSNGRMQEVNNTTLKITELPICMWTQSYLEFLDSISGWNPKAKNPFIRQQAIEASSDEMDYEIIVPKIEVGGYYEIMNFRTNKTRAQYRVVLHNTHIMLTSKIVFKKLASVFLPIPWHKFFLQDYNRLYPRLNKLDILTDVIGHLVAVQALEPIQINQRIDHKCNLVIQNIKSFHVHNKI